MDQLAGGRGGVIREVVLLAQHDLQPSAGGIAGDARPVDPAADDQEVDWFPVAQADPFPPGAAVVARRSNVEAARFSSAARIRIETGAPEQRVREREKLVPSIRRRGALATHRLGPSSPLAVSSATNVRTEPARSRRHRAAGGVTGKVCSGRRIEDMVTAAEKAW
jgi:hypothetical protein